MVSKHYPTIFYTLTFIGGALLLYYCAMVQYSSEISPFEIECPTQGIVSVRDGGRLGNAIWEYASTVALANTLNLTPCVPRSILKSLRDVFQNLSVPAYEDTILSDHCRKLHGGNKHHCKIPRAELDMLNVSVWDNLCNTLTRGSALDTKTAHIPTENLRKMYKNGQLSDPLVLPKWIVHAEAVSKLGENSFNHLFHFRSDVLILVKKTIRGLLASIEETEANVSLVGMHVRRSDYNAYLRRKYGGNTSTADADFYKRAMTRMRQLMPANAVFFVVVSDDRDWCMKTLVNESSGVLWGGMEGSPFHSSLGKLSQCTTRSHDLALLATLNGTIISYGTFGVTGALLSGGHTIAFNLSVDPKFQTPLSVLMSEYFHNWEVMT